MTDQCTVRRIVERNIELLALRPSRGHLTCTTRARLADGLWGTDDVDAAGLELLAPTRNAEANASSPSLCYTCDSCGAMVPGALQTAELVTCPRCAVEGERDRVARAILSTAGVLS